jgi:hypothetical protein
MIAAFGAAPLLACCAIVSPPVPTPESPSDRYVGTTRWVDPKHPLEVCAAPPERAASFGIGCKVASNDDSFTIGRQLFTYNFGIPISNGYEVTDQSGNIGYITNSGVILMLDETQRKAHVDAKHECDRRGGIRVGMTRAQVYASCWGKPKSINETTTANANHEQLVYGNSYVYLDHGVVTAIQTSR